MKMCKVKMKRNIQKLAFAVHEAVLYLDGHPCCKKALAYYHKYNALLQEAVCEYEKNFGPLTQYGVTGDEWTWIKGPWPWEYEANCPESEEVRRNVAVR